MPSTLISNLELTDDQLRQKLKAHGINAGPITHTTRNVYLKKLDKVMKEGGDLHKNAYDKLPIIKTSTPISSIKSPELSKTETPDVSTNTKINYIPPTPSPPNSFLKLPKSSGFLFHSTLNDDNSLKNKKEARFSLINSNKRLVEDPQNISDKHNESQDKVVKAPLDSDHLHRFAASRLRDAQAQKNSLESIKDQNIINEQSIQPKTSLSQNKIIENRLYDNSHKLNSYFGKGTENAPSDYIGIGKNENCINRQSYNTPYKSSSNFHNMSSLERIKRNLTYQPPYGMRYNYTNYYSFLFKLWSFIKFNWKRIINFLILFAIIAAIFYVIKSMAKLYSQDKDHSSMKLKENNIECNEQNSKSVACLQKNKSLLSLQIAKNLHKILAQRAGKYECNYFSTRSRNFTLDEIMIYLQAKYPSIPRYQLQETLYSTIEMIMKHPHWGINYSDVHGKTEDVIPSDVHWLAAQKPAIPLWCKCGRAISYLISQFFTFLIGLLLVGGITYASYAYLRHLHAEKNQVYQMIEKATDILRGASESANRNSPGSQPYVAIHHLRDRLIPPHQRKQMQRAWEKVVDYLSNHDSRIRMESQMIHGEPFDVWRWLPSPNEPGQEVANAIGSHKTGGAPKSWQGPAFDNTAQYGAQGLTECLKIRNMFDKGMETGYDWPDQVKNVILEKCGPSAQIVHMVIDQGSPEGCVYLKCSTPPAAGLAFHALHGWWYDGNLITVKYIRLERYHERFPDSVNANAPLRISQSNTRGFNKF